MMTRTWKAVTRLALVGILLVVLVSCASIRSPDPPSSEPVFPSTTADASSCTAAARALDPAATRESLAYQFAVIDEGRPVPKTGPLVDRFSELLEHLDAKTPDSMREIADMTVDAYYEVLDRGRSDIGFLEFVDGIDEALRWEKGYDYAEIMAIFVTTLTP